VLSCQPARLLYLAILRDAAIFAAFIIIAGGDAVFRADAVQLSADTLAARSRLLRYLWCSSTQSLPVSLYGQW